MAKGISINQLTGEVTNILEQYGQEVQEAVDQNTAKETYKAASRVKRAISASGIKSTKYSKSIASKIDRGRIYTTGTVYARAPHYRLTHLLENGHIIKNKHGTYGRTRAFKHRKPANDETEKAYLESTHEAIGKVK